MDKLRVLIANEPRFYREGLAAAMQLLRPGLDVIRTEPDNLDGDVGRHRPQVVICSQLTAAVLAGIAIWILLYPEGENHAVIGIGEQRMTVPGIEFDRILTVIDEATHAGQMT